LTLDYLSPESKPKIPEEIFLKTSPGMAFPLEDKIISLLDNIPSGFENPTSARTIFKIFLKLDFTLGTGK